MIKTYKLRILEYFAISIFINGVEQYISFKGHFGQKGTFTTDNEDIQKALEANKSFNRDYYLFFEEETNEVKGEKVEVKETTKLEVKSVKNLQEANAFIKERFGEENSFRSSSKAVDFCKENGVELIFEK